MAMTDHTHIPEEVVQDDGEVTLRCNRCGKPITPETAVLTPTGYRCKECIRGQQKVFNTAKPIDLVIGFVVSALITFGGSWLVPRLGFITLLVAPGVGLLISNAVRVAVKRRRSSTLNLAVLIGSIVGSLPLGIRALLPIFGGALTVQTGLWLPFVWQIVYSVLVASAAYSQSRGIRI